MKNKEKKLNFGTQKTKIKIHKPNILQRKQTPKCRTKA